jgi:hypothetical protein
MILFDVVLQALRTFRIYPIQPRGEANQERTRSVCTSADHALQALKRTRINVANLREFSNIMRHFPERALLVSLMIKSDLLLATGWGFA